MSSDKAKLSLQSKVSITLFAIMAAQVIIGSLVLDAVVAPAFRELENDAALKDVRRAERAIGAELRDLVRLSRDWGPWDDTFKFVRGEYPGFEQSNLTGGTLDDLGLNLLLFYDLDRGSIGANC